MPRARLVYQSGPVCLCCVWNASRVVSVARGGGVPIFLFPESGFAVMTLDELQQLISRMYSRKDNARGVEGTFMWLMEEVGELAAALRESSKEEIAKEFADVLAWLATIANVAGISLTEAIELKYGKGCPGCGQMVCRCADSEKP